MPQPASPTDETAPLDATSPVQPTETAPPPQAPADASLGAAALDGTIVQNAPAGKRQSGASIVRNTLVANFAALFSIVTGFFLTPILLKALGTSTFGVWSLALSIVGQLAIIQFGLNTSIPQQVAAVLARGDRDELDKIFSTSFAVYVVCGAFTLLATGALVIWAPLLFKVPAAQMGLVRWTLFLLGINQALNFIIALRDALVFGSGRMFMTSSINMLVNVLITLGFIGMALIGWGTIGMAIVFLIATVVNIALYQKFLSDDFSGLRPRWSAVNRETLNRLLRIGRNSFAVSLSGAFSFNANNLILGALLTPQSLAYYALSVRLVLFVNALSTKFSSVSLPVYSQAYAAGDVAQMRRIFTESITFAMGIVVPFLLVSMVLGPRLILAWVGPGNEAAAGLWVLGMATFLCRLPGGIGITLLNGADKAHLIIKVYLAASIVDVILSYFLTRAVGAAGVYWGSIIVGVVVDFVWLPFIVCREFGFSTRAFWRDGLAPLIPSTVVGGAVALTIARVTLPPGLMVTLSATLILLFSSWITWFFVGLPASRRQRFTRAFGRALRRG